jgi:hypothetical protein
MRDCKDKKYFKRIIEDAEIIKFIRDDVEYARRTLFSKSELGRQNDFDPNENPPFGEDFF